MKNDKKIDKLKKETGCKYAIDQKNFEKLGCLIRDLLPKVFIDYAGGDLAGKILKMMPYNS